jgi:hypothetical protein
VLLTASREDAFSIGGGGHMCRVAKAIADCRAFLNNEGGHPLMWSRPDDFRAVSDYFLNMIEQDLQ